MAMHEQLIFYGDRNGIIDIDSRKVNSGRKAIMLEAHKEALFMESSRTTRSSCDLHDFALLIRENFVREALKSFINILLTDCLFWLLTNSVDALASYPFLALSVYMNECN